MRARRPYRVTVAGGRCIGTFATEERARDRAIETLAARRAVACWVHHRESNEWVELMVREDART